MNYPYLSIRTRFLFFLLELATVEVDDVPCSLSDVFRAHHEDMKRVTVYTLEILCCVWLKIFLLYFGLIARCRDYGFCYQNPARWTTKWLCFIPIFEVSKDTNLK